MGRPQCIPDGMCIVGDSTGVGASRRCVDRGPSGPVLHHSRIPREVGTGSVSGVVGGRWDRCTYSRVHSHKFCYEVRLVNAAVVSLERC